MNDRIIAVGREESDSCQKSTPGCCIDHEAEARRSGWDKAIESGCETW